MARPLSPAAFREECERRLIPTWDLMQELGLRSRASIHERVKAGKLPQPIYTDERVVSLWDRDDLDLPDTKEAVA